MTSESQAGPLVSMALFGFLSGLPLSLTAFTLQLWFTSYGLPAHLVALTAWLGLPYTLKFLWSGFFDRTPSWLAPSLGRRRGWLLVVQPCLAAAATCLALSNPGRALWLTLSAGLLLAFLSASQDILIDAWRIEVFPERRQGAALAVYVWGYRAAMLTCTSGVPLLSAVAGWHGALLAMAGLLACGVLVTWRAQSPAASGAAVTPAGWRAAARGAFWAPLGDILGRRNGVAVLAFVLLFRLGKVFADGSAAAFYRYGVGFTAPMIGQAGLYGWAGTLAGAAAGGWLVLRCGTRRAVLVAGLAQVASLGLYLALLATGPSTLMLTIKMLGENFAGSVADMAFLAYLSSLCSASFTAAQYALLSSLAAVAFHTLGGLSGYAAEALGYAAFYLASMLAGLPALLIMLRLRPPASDSPT